MWVLRLLIDLLLTQVDVSCNIVEYISYNMGTRDLPDIYARALGPAALGLGHIYQANPSCSCYNLYLRKLSKVHRNIEIAILRTFTIKFVCLTH